MDNPPRITSQTDPSVRMSQPGAAPCVLHPNVAATFCCKHCGRTFCDACGFNDEDGNTVCTECMTRPTPPPVPPSVASPEDATPPPLPNTPLVRAGAMCVQHPNVQATQQCKRCGAFMCPTCDFSFPGGIHFCPACASKSEDGLSPRRKKSLIASYALAAWSTVGMTCLVSGAMSAMVRSKGEQAALGWVLLIFVLAPAITGLSLGVSTRRKHAANPATIWIAIVWNAILLASFVTLMLIGLSRQ